MLSFIRFIPFLSFCGATLCFSFPGGSLQAAISENAKSGNHFQECKLKDILLQISLGLKYIHNSGMAHLDIKPSQYSSPLAVFSSFPTVVRICACVSIKCQRCCLLAESLSSVPLSPSPAQISVKEL